MPDFRLYLADGRTISSNGTLVMGILNATPDSFSDGGELSDKDSVKKRVRQMIKDGADILDVGGESTRPGHQKVDESTELARVLPIIKIIREVSEDVPISVDTSKATVAQAALSAGASLVNDVSALEDEKMSDVINQFKCSIILMRGQSTGDDPVAGCRKQFSQIIKIAQKRNIDTKRLLLDPGLGFGDLATGNYKVSPGSDLAANIKLIIGIKDYSLGFPVVIGASRKRFVGDFSGVENAKDRLAGSLAAAVMAKESGAAIIRVHDVKETIQSLSIN